MSDKTIAEIMGWETRYEHWTDGDTMCAGNLTYGPDGERRYAQHGPTVDDMLAWLREQVYHPEWNTERGVHISITDDGVFLGWYSAAGADGLDYPQPNLHAALEAAVRAVHDAEEAK